MVKRKKHPDAPKAALGSYMWFCQDKRQTVKEEMPELSNKMLLSELGKRWQLLTAEEKVEYEDLAKKDKARFGEEKAEFLKTHDSLYIEGGGGGKKTKDPNAPKRARSAYILYTSDKRPDLAEQAKAEGWKQTQVVKKLAELWNDLDMETKEKYYKLAAKEKEQYQIAYKKYSEGLSNAQSDDE